MQVSLYTINAGRSGAHVDNMDNRPDNQARQAEIIEKLSLIESLFAGATTPGEKDAADRRGGGFSSG
jgi:hypothetical protein